jgi:hypothetical protein
VRDFVTRVKNNASGTASRQKRQYGLDSHEEGRHFKGLEENLDHFFTVYFRIHSSLSQKARLLIWRHLQFVIYSMPPYLLHSIPVCDHTMLDWESQGKNSTTSFGLISEIDIALFFEFAWIPRLSNYGRENTRRSIVARNSCLADA